MTDTQKIVPDTDFMDRNTPRPTDITLHQVSGVLDVAFDDVFSFEFAEPLG